MLIDTHFHLDLMENMRDLIWEIDGADIGVVAVGTTPKAYKQELRFCADTENIKVGLGFHPQLVSERASEIELFLDLIKDGRYIGEIGLDFNSSYVDSKEKQLNCFRKITKACADQGGKILSIHSVKSAKTIVEVMISAGTFETCICIFHWFTGTVAERNQLIDAGAYFSINPKMLKTKSGQEIIRTVPENRILLETDAPFTMKFTGINDIEKELISIVDGISSIRGKNLMNQIQKNGDTIWL